MANLIDSKADFRAGVNKVGLSEYWEKFEQRNWTTYANFAFASAYTPGAANEEGFIKDVVKVIVGENVQMHPAIRRLYFEAHTFVNADMRNRVERTD